LLQMSPLLYWKAETDGYRGQSGAIQDKVRSDRPDSVIFEGEKNKKGFLACEGSH